MSNVGYSLTCTPEVIQHTSYKAKVRSNVRLVALLSVIPTNRVIVTMF
jgi:hypothetical protein